MHHRWLPCAREVGAGVGSLACGALVGAPCTRWGHNPQAAPATPRPTATDIEVSELRGTGKCSVEGVIPRGRMEGAEVQPGTSVRGRQGAERGIPAGLEALVLPSHVGRRAACGPAADRWLAVQAERCRQEPDPVARGHAQAPPSPSHRHSPCSSSEQHEVYSSARLAAFGNGLVRPGWKTSPSQNTPACRRGPAHGSRTSPLSPRPRWWPSCPGRAASRLRP